MLKLRLIPVLTFDGISLVKTKEFSESRIVGNPIQAARVYNSRNVDELVFIDIKASEQKRKINLSLVKKVIDECFMPVTIGGGINTFDDINNLLGIGADKILIKSKAIDDPIFIENAVKYFGSQCISISVDVIKKNEQFFIYNLHKNDLQLNDFINEMNKIKVGEFIVNAVYKDGLMNGFDSKLYKIISNISSVPIVALGGAGKPEDFTKLIESGFFGGLASSSIYHFTQYTPNDIKLVLNESEIPVRI